MNEYRCADEDFITYPNPTYKGSTRVANDYNKPPINLIRVYDASGKFIQEQSYTPDFLLIKHIEFENKGLFFLEIHSCEGQIVTKQILVL